MVASFLLLCAMSGGKAMADPQGWNPFDSLIGAGNVSFTDRSEYKNLNYTGGMGIFSVPSHDAAIEAVNIKLNSSSPYLFENISVSGNGSGSVIHLENLYNNDDFSHVQMTINNAVTFRNNHTNDLGGSIYLHHSTLTFNRAANFEGNYIERTGGAINNNGIIKFENGATFNGNYVTGETVDGTYYSDGGALYVAQDGETTINNATFENNHAGQYGGAVYNANILTINGGTFEGNYIKKTADAVDALGGAIYSKGEVVLDSTNGNILFRNNSVKVGDETVNNDIYLAADTTKNGSLTLQGTKNSITFNGSILGEEATTITSSANNLILKGDNSGYKGTFTQTGGTTSVNNKFFGGSKTHVIEGGTLAINASDAIEDSLISVTKNDTNSTVGTLELNTNTTLTGKVSGDGNITNSEKNTLTLTGNNSRFTGAFSQTRGELIIGDGTTETKSFAGSHNIVGGDGVTISQIATMSGTDNNFQQTTVNVNGTLEGTDNEFISSTVTVNGTMQGTNKLTNGTQVTVKNGGVLQGTNTIQDELTKVTLESGATLNGANTTLNSGLIEMTGAQLNGLSSMTGGRLTMTGGSITGVVAMSGGVSDLSGTEINNTVTVNTGHELTIGVDENGNSTSFGVSGSLAMAGGTANIKQDIELSKGDITGSTGTINMPALSEATPDTPAQGTDLTISGDLSDYSGDFNKTGGTITIGTESASATGKDTENNFFTGNSSLDGVTVNMNNSSSLAAETDKTITVKDTIINITNEGLTSYKEDDAGNVTLKTNGNKTVIGNIKIADDATEQDSSQIIVSGDNTVLEIAGDASEYTGIFSQTGGTTHVTDGSVFFGGDSTITKGNLVFDLDSELAQDSVVNIESANVNLSIGGSKNLQFHNGNEVSLGGGNFVLKEVTLKNQINNDPLTIYDSKRYFDENAGLGSKADHTLGKTPTETGEGGNADYIFLDNSVAEDGSKLTINDGSSVTVNANVMKDSNGNDSGFGADISGRGTVTTQNNIAQKDDALVFTSDNSGFGGEYSHNGGIIKFKGADNTANFFNGENAINAGSVIFAANSVVMGKNTVHSGANIELTDGSSIADGTEITLNDNSKLDITNATEDIDLSVGVKGNAGAVINKTADGKLIVSDNQNEFKGIFNHQAGNTTVNAGKSFFAGKNNISVGTVDLTQVDNTTNTGAALAGDNTITDNGLIKIGDFTDTSAITDSIKVNTGAGDTAHGLQLVTTDENHKNLEVGFAIEGTGRVIHTGNGTLNLNNAGENELFANYTGTFTHDAATTGITNVFGKSFAKNDIQNGTLNLKNGSILVKGVTKLTGDGTLNIGNIDNEVIPEGEEAKYAFDKDSKVTIASSISGDGKVNISNGTTTLEATSNNADFEGAYRQTGDSVVEAKAGSTFFGGINNLIEKGKLLFRKDAKLAENSAVELSGNMVEPENDGDRPLEKAVLDLDGRENAVFNGTNELTLAGESAAGAKFVFTDGILQNALLHGTQNIGSAADATKDEVITLGAGSGFASDAVVTINGVSEDRAPEVVLASGSVAADGSKAQIGENGILYLVSDGLDYYTITTGNGFVGVGKDPREEHAPNINIYNDQSGFKGDFYQDAGRVTVKEGATFFAGDSANDKNIVITGNLDNGTNGELYLEKGSFIGGDIMHVVNAAVDAADQGAFSPHGRVYIADKIYTQDGIELTDINELMKGDLYYNTKYDENGNLLVDELKNIKINNAGLVLANGTVFDGSQGITEFNKQNNGVVDIGFSDGAGVNGDIRLGDETMLSYGDNAFIKDDSTLEMSDSAVLNFMNENTTLNYNPDIVGGGAIYKEGLAVTNVASAIDMTGELKVSEGTLNFTNKDKVIFNKGDGNPRQTGSATIGSDSSSANLSIAANQTVFGGDVIANAQNDTQSVLALAGKNTEIGGNLSTNNTAVSIFGDTIVGGNWSVDGNTSLNLAGNYANTIDIAGDLVVGANAGLKDGKLPVSFDYDPHRGAMDTINVDSFVNDSNSPLLITGINFVTSPVDRNFDLSADKLIQQRNPQDTPYYDPTSFYANTAMGRYFLSNGAGGGADFSGTLVHLNPQQYRGQVATIASWQNQLLINNLLFDHMDIVTRQLMDDEKTANKYAATIPQFAPYQYDLKGGSLWYKAYGNFETLSMTKGLSVGNNAYGALVGADFPLIKLKHGWNIVPTAYIGYNGAHQHFNGVSMYQNGAQLGLMGTAYKGNFLTSLLAYGGGYGNDMSVRGEYGGGSDNTGNWFAGVASKTAYNIHLPADFIFQPTLMAAYNAFGSQNWGSDFGVMSMSSGMLNGINVAPGFNLIWQKKSFNIYLTAQMVYNIMGGVDGKAGNVDLGYVRMRHSYFEYGLGISKNFKDRFGGFLQFVIRNGGRTGIGFSGGIQIKLGK